MDWCLELLRVAFSLQKLPHSKKKSFFWKEHLSTFRRNGRQSSKVPGWRFLCAATSGGQGTGREGNTEHSSNGNNSIWMEDVGEIRDSTQWPLEIIHSGRSRWWGSYNTLSISNSRYINKSALHKREQTQLRAAIQYSYSPTRAYLPCAALEPLSQCGSNNYQCLWAFKWCSLRTLCPSCCCDSPRNLGRAGEGSQAQPLLHQPQQSEAGT